MKKVFALLSIAFMAMLFSPVFAQNTTSSTLAVSNSGVLSPIEAAISPENSTTAYVLEKLESYAKSLQVPVEHLYKVLILQQKVNAITNSLFLFLSILFIFLTIWLGKKSDWDYPDFYRITSICVGTISVIMLIFSIVAIPDTITAIVNPEYGVFQEIVKMLK